MKLLAALAIACLGFGCSSAVTSSSAPSPSAPGPEPSSTASSESPTTSPSEPLMTTAGSLLGRLRTRDREVLLYASRDGMKVTVKASNGALIADRVDIDALRALDPHIYEICRSGVASGPAYLDATLDTRMRGSESREESTRPMPRWQR